MADQQADAKVRCCKCGRLLTTVPVANKPSEEVMCAKCFSEGGH